MSLDFVYENFLKWFSENIGFDLKCSVADFENSKNRQNGGYLKKKLIFHLENFLIKCPAKIKK